MNYGKILGRAALGALALAVIPYQFKKDPETGAFEMRSLLWGWRKTPAAEGETKDHICFAIPASGLDTPDEQIEEAVDAASEEDAPAAPPAEAPIAEESAG